MTGKKPVRSAAIITNGAFSLFNFRGPLIRRMVAQGIQVHALAPDYTEETRAAVRALGATPVDISLERTGLSPRRDLADMMRLVRTLRRIRPDLTFSYFIKPVIYGSLAAWLARVPRRYALVAGLGYAFASNDAGETPRRRLLRTIASRMYRQAFRVCHRVFLQNDDDVEVLCGSGILPRSKAFLVNGTGVDLDMFAQASPVTSPITFILVARLLREKGIVEYVDAARRIKKDSPETRFLLLGGLDSNPDGLTRQDVLRWVEEGTIEWPGQVPDVRSWLALSSVFVLPSYYREGKPRSTQEALALGRPVITTDAPGCRDTVEDGVNGFSIAVRDVGALEKAMRQFLQQPGLIISMGAESRRLAEERFDVHRINSIMLDVMGLSPEAGSQVHNQLHAQESV